MQRLSVVLALVSSFVFSQALSGSYTVGAGGSYPNLSAAFSALTAQGVAGPVTLNVLGAEVGPVVLANYPGAGVAAPLTIVGGTLSGLSSPVLNITGGSYITFSGVTITGTGSQVLLAMGVGASNITFSTCSITEPTSTTNTATVIQVAGASNVTIADSTFGGGYEALNHSAGTGLIIERCRITGGSFWIIQLNAPNEIFRNNFVTGQSNYGLRVGAASTGAKVLNNSFYINHPTATSQYCALRWYGATTLNTECIGNIFHEFFGTAGNGVNMWCSGTNRPTVMNGNCFWPVNALGVVFFASNLNFAGWQALGNDLNSISADPLYVNPTATPPDLHLQSLSPCIGVGLASPSVIDDFDGQTRAGLVDIGADEAVVTNLLTATTTGSGAGDLFLSLTLIDPLATEGWCLLSTDTSHPVGTGPLLSLWPDALTWSILSSQPLAAGNPLHFPVGIPGVFPDTAIALPPGALSAFAGTSWDVVGVLVAPGYVYVGRSNTRRLNW